MHTRSLNLFVKASVAALSLALASPQGVWAGGDHHEGYRNGNHYGHSSKYGRSGKYGHSGQYKGYPGHGGYGYKRSYSSKYVTKYYYDDDNDGENLLIGLLVGGLVGYAIGDSRQEEAPVVYYPPASPVSRQGYTTTPYQYDGGEGGCLQEREYQNKVIIGGKAVDAYGTACLQPDGSWRYGPAQLASF